MHTYCFGLQSPTNTLVCGILLRQNCMQEKHSAGQEAKPVPQGFPLACQSGSSWPCLLPFPVMPSCLTLRLHQVSRLLDCEITLFFFLHFSFVSPWGAVKLAQRGCKGLCQPWQELCLLSQPCWWKCFPAAMQGHRSSSHGQPPMNLSVIHGLFMAFFLEGKESFAHPGS